MPNYYIRLMDLILMRLINIIYSLNVNFHKQTYIFYFIFDFFFLIQLNSIQSKF